MQLRVPAALLSALSQAGGAIGVVEVLPDGALRLAWLNARLAALLGRPATELAGMLLSDFIQPQNQPVLFARYQQCIECGAPVQFEEVFYLPDGGDRWWQNELLPATDESGQVTHIVFLSQELPRLELLNNSVRQARFVLDSVIAMLPAFLYSVEVINDAYITRYVSQNVQELFGWSRERILRDPQFWTEQIHPEDRANVWQQVDEAWEDKQLRVKLIYRFASADGRWRLVQDEAALSISPHTGNLVLDGFIREVGNIASGLEVLHNVARNFPGAIFVIQRTADGKFWLPYFGTGFGGRWSTDALPVGWNGDLAHLLAFVHPDDRGTIADLATSHLAAPGAWRGVIRLAPDRVGDVWALAAIHAEHVGSVVRWYGVITDVTEQHQSSTRATARENLFRTLVENNPSILCMHDVTGAWLFAGPEITQATGYDPDDLVGQSIFPYLHPDDVETQRRALAKILAGETVQSDAFRLRCRDGNYAWAQSRLQPVLNPMGEVVAIQSSTINLTGQQASVERMQERARRYDNLARSTSGLYWELDEGLFVSDVSGATEAFFGELLEDVRGRWFPSLVDLADRGRTRRALEDCIANRNTIRGLVVRIRPRADAVRWLELDGAPVLGDGDVCVGVFGTARDVTERLENVQSLQRLAIVDPLTGLYNRAALLSHLDGILEGAARDQAAFALLFLDMNGFKPINDSYGHDVGDQVLREVAERIRGTFRSHDFVARLGGDEFVVVLSDLPRSGVAMTVQRAVKGVREAFSTPFVLKGRRTHRLTCSIGAAVYPEDGESSETLLQVADTRMYADKRQTDPDATS